MRIVTAAICLMGQALVLPLLVAAPAAAGTAPGAGSERPAYVIVQENVVDHKAFDSYRKAASPVLREYHGRPIAATERVQVLEGKWAGNRTAVIEFPSLAEAKKWYSSQSYQKAIPIRRGATSFSNLVIVEGAEPVHPAGGVHPGH